MSKTFTAGSIHEAVDLARQLRDEERYDLFRGQRQDWPLRSSLARLNFQAEIERATKQMQLFFSWIASTPDLHEFANLENLRLVDQKYAIAQHYGLATNFCDFTTEPAVAGFFASSHPPRAGETSVILCCNSSELIE